MATVSDVLPQSQTGAAPRPLVGRLLYAGVAVVTAAFVLLAGGIFVGCWRLWPVAATAPDAHVAHDSLLFLVPIPAANVQTGDRIVVHEKGERHARLYKVESMLSTIDGSVEVRDPHGTPIAMKLPKTAWRVSRSLPVLGAVLRLVPGGVIPLLMIVLGAGLLLYARFRREPAVHPQ